MLQATLQNLYARWCQIIGHRRTPGRRQHRHKLRRLTNVRNRGSNTSGSSSNPEVPPKVTTTNGNGREDSVTASWTAVAVQHSQKQGVAQWEGQLVERTGDGLLPSPLLFGSAKQRFHNLGIHNSLVLVVCPIFCTSEIVSVAQLSLSIDSRSRGCGEVGSA